MALPAGVPAAGQGEPLPGVTGPPPREGDVVGGELGRVAWHVSWLHVYTARLARGTWQGEHPLAQAPLAAVLLGGAGRALGHHAAQRGAGGELGRDPCTGSAGECPNLDNDTFGTPLLKLSFRF